ncbi:unnamed protein product [Pneumocystis jirovecii]|uniref:Uncharacterized protein n=2 Tax=Pneumocystis jirovecii TaxID=42068 RepID=L0PEZ9_PNEJI|nr:uncharacterized protein T551_02964 [Pneumocystis jirovecii RU7]KTW27465.1 hypothetical protein T551_02964 [Pneumocystis jirovecii RU7]CCJ30220.1 unnamed protein product [Pneumocystis jirovecii]
MNKQSTKSDIVSIDSISTHNSVSDRVLLRQCTAPLISSWTAVPINEPVPEALVQKFEHFRALKKQGIHLNTSLDNSISFKNPRLLDKLADFVGITDQYGSNLPLELQSWQQLSLEMKESYLAEKQTKKSKSSAQNLAQRTEVQFVPEKQSKSTR